MILINPTGRKKCSSFFVVENGTPNRSLGSSRFEEEHRIALPYVVNDYNPETSIIIVYERSNDDSVTWEAMEIKLDEVP